MSNIPLKKMSDLSMIRVFLKDNNFHNIALASYGMLNGIEILANWTFRDDQEIDLYELFKIILSNVHTQNMCYYEDNPCSRMDTEQITVFYSIFLSNYNSSRTIPFCIAFFIDPAKIQKSPYINDLIMKRLYSITSLVKACMQEIDFTFANLTPKIRSIAISCGFVLQSGIEKPMFKLPNQSDIDFFAACLQSHLQTQMITVIETKDMKSAAPLFNLLAHFLLPEQMKFSLKELNAFPVPGMFLQCISPQDDIPYQELFQFSTPFTYIRLDERKVYASTNFILQNSIANEYAESILFAVGISDNEVAIRMNKIKKQFDMKEVDETCDYIKDLFKSFYKVSEDYCYVLCQQKLAELVQRAVLAIEISTSMCTQTKKSYLVQSQKDVISELLQNPGKEEMKMIISIAQMFDDTIYKRFYAGRQEILKQIIVTI